MNALQIMNEIEANGIKVLNGYKNTNYFYPLSMIYKTKEKRANIENINNKKDAKGFTCRYIKRTLEILEEEKVNNKKTYEILESVLLWSDISKIGTKAEINKWKKLGYNLYIHNLGSSDIYLENTNDAKSKKRIVSLLIKTHGLIGQYIRGETRIEESAEVIQLIEEKLINKEDLKQILEILNKCIIKAVKEELWNRLSKDVYKIIDDILNNKYKEKNWLKRISALRGYNDSDYKIIENSKYKNKFEEMFKYIDLWFVESALSDFNLEEFLKIFALIFKEINLSEYSNLSFEKFMDNIYYDRKGEKKVNLYKKRIVEKYLSGVNLEQNIFPINENVAIELTAKKDTLLFDFKFSKAAEKLIEFCEVAETTQSPIYERSIIMLYDMFEFRKDKYDWFFNESSYLSTMNKTITFKSVILDYIVGNYVVDVGPGGGALMDMIEDRYPNKKIVGIDISKNVVEELNKIKKENKRHWNVMEMDILNAAKEMKKDSVDSIIFCAVIHELFSYIETDGKKFNYKTIEEVLKNAYYILKPGGRIIIRDGVKTDSSEKRIIKFKSEEGIKFFNNYVKDFKGRKIHFELIEDNQILLPVNDAMEFLYTYTWGVDSYPREVQEQFGYFSPKEFIKFINDHLENANIIELQHYLQDGYEENILKLVDYYDEKGNKTKLPDSTCLVVIEKPKN